GGGPDAEREVSLESSRAVADALERGGGFEVVYEVIDRIGAGELRALPGDVVFPVLHGAFGEGGRLQDLLELDGRAYVGSGPGAARLAMDKLGSKIAAAGAGAPTPIGACLNVEDDASPIGLPCVVKPVHEGSSVGLSICRDADAWEVALAGVRADRATRPERVWMVERLVEGREVTVGLLDRGAGLESVGVVEIEAAGGSYDYEAKYRRDDTRYTVDPALPSGVGEAIGAWSVEVARRLGVRHLARVDYLLDGAGVAWFLEINTMPGFTAHSLLPMAAGARGLGMDALCAGLVERALGERAGVRSV
ncbi:MAG: ATP-grasp domain-containing protein, partial [Phycisphaerales bacterium JB059]